MVLSRVVARQSSPVVQSKPNDIRVTLDYTDGSRIADANHGLAALDALASWTRQRFTIPWFTTFARVGARPKPDPKSSSMVLEGYSMRSNPTSDKHVTV